MLTLTWRGAFWLGVFFVVTALMHFGISAILGFQEPMFALLALAILGILIVAAGYTGAKKLLGRSGRDSTRTPDE